MIRRDPASGHGHEPGASPGEQEEDHRQEPLCGYGETRANVEQCIPTRLAALLKYDLDRAPDAERQKQTLQHVRR